MDPRIERKKAEAELWRVRSARMDLELKILEREADIERLKESVAIQEAKELELEEKMANLK